MGQGRASQESVCILSSDTRRTNIREDNQCSPHCGLVIVFWVPDQCHSSQPIKHSGINSVMDHGVLIVSG